MQGKCPQEREALRGSTWHDVWLQTDGLPDEYSPTVSVFKAVKDIGKKTKIKWPVPHTLHALSQLIRTRPFEVVGVVTILLRR